eukprot:jgi/Botrbrau1/10690/Bobra.139_2s0020.1
MQVLSVHMGRRQGMGFPTTMVAHVTRGQEAVVILQIHVPDLCALPWSFCHVSVIFYTFLGSGTCFFTVITNPLINGFPPISINTTCVRRGRGLRWLPLQVYVPCVAVCATFPPVVQTFVASHNCSLRLLLW